MIKVTVGLVAAAAAAIALAAALPEKSFRLTIIDDALPAEQQVMKVSRDATVRLLVSSDVSGTLHLHGYRMEVKLVPGKSAEVAFKAYATGRYPFEWHRETEKTQVTRRHGSEFAVLEVHPN